MTEASHPHLTLIQDYLRALEQYADEATLSGFFTPDVQQHEFPNRVVENGAHRGVTELLQGQRKGRLVAERQRFAIQNALVDGDRVAMELTWTARLKVPLGKLQPGDEMRAHCGVFFRIEGGRIAEQHNFDCFDPF